MHDGKKSVAERIVYGGLEIIKERTGDDPLKVFKKAIDNAKPSLEVKSRRVGGFELPGADRGQPEPAPVTEAFAGWSATRVSAATARRCRRSWPTSCSMHRTCVVAP